MTNLMIPEELTPLANFNWSQFSDTYAQDADIQQDPHVSIQIESGIPGNGSKVVVDVKDVPIGSSGFLPNTNRVQLYGWREDRNGDISTGGYCSFDGGNYKILRKFEEAPFDWLLEDADYTVEDMVKDFTKEVKDYLDYGNYRYHAVYDALTQTYDDLYKEHEDALSMMHTKSITARMSMGFAFDSMPTVKNKISTESSFTNSTRHPSCVCTITAPHVSSIVQPVVTQWTLNQKS